MVIICLVTISVLLLADSMSVRGNYDFIKGLGVVWLVVVGVMIYANSVGRMFRYLFLKVQTSVVMPQSTEMTLFITSVTFLALSFLSSEMRDDLVQFLQATEYKASLLVLLFMIGVYVSVLHVFVRRPKTRIEMNILKLFQRHLKILYL